MSIMTTISLPGARAGAVAVAALGPTLAATLETVLAGAVAEGVEDAFVFLSSVGGFTSAGSRINALSPRPKAFRAIGYNLLRELEIALSPFTMYVVKHYRLTMAGRFRQPYVPRNYGLVDLRAEEATQVRRDLFRERRAVIVHREQNPFDGKRRINCPPQPHQ